MDLVEPKITAKADQPMLTYSVTGDPGNSGKEAMGALMNTFFKLKKQHKLTMSPVIARWPMPFDTPKEEWIGVFGLPVNESVTEIPTAIKEKFPKLKLEIWTYGETAEILHVGSYAKETETIEKLHKYISDSGYTIAGVHEEEYVKGPGMFSKGNVDKYLTIIRYPVSKL
jgi:hypothetical protein